MTLADIARDLAAKRGAWMADDGSPLCACGRAAPADGRHQCGECE